MGLDGAARPQRALIVAAPIGVLLMTYGSAATGDDVPAYLASVRGGRAAPDDLVAEFRRRYELIGFSPLVRITQAQGQALQEMLDVRDGRGAFRVEVGMLHSEPRIEAAVRRLSAAGVERVVGVVLSPQWSPIIMGGYTRAVEAARSHLPAGVPVTVAGAGHELPGFIDALAARVAEALERLPADRRETVPVVLTAHSLPLSVVEREPGYLEQIMTTVAAVVARAGLHDGRWQFAYQSAGHSPEEWLKPDLKDVLPGIRLAGHEDVLVVPVQFLADHLEILYDIDVAAREEAEEAGLRFHRIELMNTMPAFIECLAAVVDREVGAPATS
ncbi:MAG: protoporphyrin/coproporphyrin ferrochelatase [Chloroflexota bacterium]|nr:protoporphyrin/coproporphyrin ferrochelatase [Chloroflexota bacterium]